MAATMLAWPLPANAQSSSTLVSYEVVCEDASLKVVFEQKVVGVIHAAQGFAIDPTGKAELKLLFAVAPVKRKKGGEEELLSLAVATLGLRNGKVFHFENRTFPPNGYEGGLSSLIPTMLKEKP
ncbi:hypothetical protein [Methylibium rhizosphaerae]|uniref:hypothetical protein n=1 Tax=Methylibium rhizosphaerae TaxID=2570323 RepID=UPI00112BD86A|nr:hypothetical protein [Methylibium rhizosphaerae]